MSPRLRTAEAMAMSNTLCGQHSFLIPLHGGKGGPLHPRHVEVRAAPRRHDAATAGARGCYRAGAEGGAA
jgi:hypothetical protein